VGEDIEHKFSECNIAVTKCDKNVTLMVQIPCLGDYSLEQL
jgi:hypothetical protein